MDQFAAEIGCTTRTIRSYHARGLLPPPVRRGRTPYYVDHHLVRMHLVLRLQRCGLPLEAVRALLEPDLVLDESLAVSSGVGGAIRGRPGLLGALVCAGVLTRGQGGALRVNGIRAVLAARVVAAPGAQLGPALRVLVEAIHRVLPHAEPAAGELRELLGDGPTHEEIVELLVETVRLGLRRSGPATDCPA
ncbi:MerR family transcriptional regulator [Umezawaea sp. NPDC059074]|uniref:MerR family transcriptional regulator n=1 Tax=Umezawaea sp. NPDC059074 TaxID=3346716 RepID=UPI0036C410C1